MAQLPPEIDLDDPPAPPRGVIERVRDGAALVVWYFEHALGVLEDGLDLVNNWLVERPIGALLKGLPAVIVAVMIVVTVIAGREMPRTDLVKHYRQLSHQEIGKEHWDAARLWQQKVIWLNPEAAEHQFGLAMVAEKHGDHERALEMMQALAPLDEDGFPDAHYWLADDLINQGLPLTDELRAILEHHLSVACASSLVGTEAHALLGQLLLQKQDLAGATYHFEQARAERPEVNLTLSALYREQGDIPASLSAARLAVRHFEGETRRNPEDWEVRHRWVQGEVFAERYQRAIQVLDGAPDSFPQSDVHQAYVNVYVSWYDYVLKQDDRNMSLQLELLTKALEYGPGNPLVLTLLADLSTREWDGALSAETLLTQALTRGDSPTMVHFILGTRALEKGDLDKAQVHLELAFERDPRMPAVLNNLAWTIAQSESADLERALALIDSALKLESRAEFSITRADILAQVRRFTEAIVELEGLLPESRDRGPLHLRLAHLYDELKQPEIAQHHRLRGNARGN